MREFSIAFLALAVAAGAGFAVASAIGLISGFIAPWVGFIAPWVSFIAPWVGFFAAMFVFWLICFKIADLGVDDVTSILLAVAIFAGVVTTLFGIFQ